MAKWKHLLQVTTLALLASACGTSSSTSVTAPSSRCGVTAVAQPSAIGAPGGSGSIVVKTDRECAWEARSESDWLVLAEASGRGDGSLRYSAAGNPVVSERRGGVLINGVRVEIGQAAAACAFSLDRPQQSVGAAGGRIDVAVGAQGGCAWTAHADAPWISIVSGASAQGSGAVSLAVSVNETAQSRSGIVTIAGLAYLIEQAGLGVAGPNPTPTPPLDPNCVLTVSPLTAAVGAEGGAIDVRVTASLATCAWTAVSAAPWMVMEGGVSETGSGARRFAIRPNPTSDARVGSLSIAGAVVTVTQAASSSPTPAPAPTPTPTPTPTPCSFTVLPTPASFPAGGDTGEITVTASARDCTWTAAPGASWITIQGATGATGSGRVRIAVAANTSTAPRSGTLLVAGSTVTITQAAAAAPTCSYAILPNPVGVGFAGDGDIDLHVVTSAGCAWTATTGTSWITITGASSGTGDSRLHIAVAPTLSISGRVGTLSIAGLTVTVNQAGILNQQVTISGTMSGLAGSCPVRSFTLSGATFVTDSATNFSGQADCGDLGNGLFARVRGVGQANGTILADKIDRIGDGVQAVPQDEE